MNIYDISKKAGVSIATVSRVLNNNSKVSEATRNKVLSVIKENSYTPNAYARGLGLDSMNTIGILCADSSDIYLANAVFFLERELRQNGYNSILCCTGYDNQNKQNCMQLLLSKRVDAIILVGSNFVEPKMSDNEYIQNAAKQVPVILVNGYLKGVNIYCILCDEHQAIYEAANRLFSAGCDNLLYLYRSLSYSGIQKKEGFMEALKDNGQESSNHIYEYNGDINEVKCFLTSLYDSGKQFNGIITSDDELAIGAVKFIKQKGLKIPENISIIGHNNSMLAACCDPELTSIDNKLEPICNHAVITLMRVFEQKSVAEKTIFSAELIIRETTKF